MDDEGKLTRSVLPHIIGSDPEYECLPTWAYDLSGTPLSLQFPAASIVDVNDMRLAVLTFQAGLGGNMNGTFLEHAIESLMTQYGGHPQRASILIRSMAFDFLVNDSRITWTRWQQRPEDSSQIISLHPAVVEAVAKAPTQQNGEFNTEEFFLLVEKIAADGY